MGDESRCIQNQMNCPHCSSTDLIHAGTNSAGAQRYQCSNGHRFMPEIAKPMKWKGEIVQPRREPIHERELKRDPFEKMKLAMTLPRR